MSAGKDKAILRFAKIKSKSDLGGALRHNLREQPTSNANPDIENVIAKGLDTVHACMDKYSDRLGNQKVRKNAVHAHEALVTGSPEKMASMTRNEQMAYFKSALKWLNELHGSSKNLVSCVIHFDETTPHMQAIYVPIDDKGKLNSRAVLGGHRNKLSDLQTEFANDVAMKHGLTRGRKKSGATHTALKDFYADMPELEKRAEELSKKIQQANMDLADLNTEIVSRELQRDDLTSEIGDLSSRLKEMNQMSLDEARGFVDELEERVKNDELRERGISRPRR